MPDSWNLTRGIPDLTLGPGFVAELISGSRSLAEGR